MSLLIPMDNERSLSRRSVNEQLDKRIPPEVWQKVFSFLYPSQLSRLSSVNKTFNKIVSSLSVWSRMFSIAHSEDSRRLRTLHGMPQSKSYMLYLCAMSLYVCEYCCKMANCKAEAKDKPKRHPTPMQTYTPQKMVYAGQEFDPHWTIHMCDTCYTLTRDTYTPGLDNKTQERLLWYRAQP